jgi:hypothetical protein
MSVLDQALQLREGFYGAVVTEPAKVLPATGIVSIFNVNNGPVLITSLIGLVTTACSATATTVTVGVTPAGGTSAPAALATAGTITSLPVGAFVGLDPFASAAPVALAVAPASGVVQGGNIPLGGAGVSLHNGGIAMVSAGVITITTNATNTGAFAWYLTYAPVVAGANVTAV